VSGAEPLLDAAVECFNDGRYLASHELLEELWESTEGPDSAFYKGLIQAAIALHHVEKGNLEGAAKLFGGHRRFLAPYLPAHRGYDLAGFLRAMQECQRAAMSPASGEPSAIDPARRPRLLKKS
jgi:predicted metal-dependent hydrolase